MCTCTQTLAKANVGQQPDTYAIVHITLACTFFFLHQDSRTQCQLVSMPKLPMLMVEPIQPQASDCGGKQAKRDKVLIDFVSPNRPKRELRTCQSLKENPIMTKTDLDDWKASVRLHCRTWRAICGMSWVQTPHAGLPNHPTSSMVCYVAPWRPHGISEHSVKASHVMRLP